MTTNKICVQGQADPEKAAEQAILSAYHAQDRANVNRDVDADLAIYTPDVVSYDYWTRHALRFSLANLRANVENEFSPGTSYLGEPRNLQHISLSASTRVVHYSFNRTRTQCRVSAKRYWRKMGWISETNIMIPQYLLSQKRVKLTESDVWVLEGSRWRIRQQFVVHRDDVTTSGYHFVNGNFTKSLPQF